MIPHVRELRLANYRGFRDARLPLAGLTFLVGRNGAGKTTLVDALSFVRDALTQSLPTALVKRDGIAEVRSRFAASGELLTVALVFGIVSDTRGRSETLSVPHGLDGPAAGTSGRCVYGFSLAADGTVAREECRSTIPGIPDFKRDASGIHIDAPFMRPKVDPELLLLPLLAGGDNAVPGVRVWRTSGEGTTSGALEWSLLRDSLVNLAVSEPDPRVIRQPSPVQALVPLERDGRNLADVLDALSQNGFAPRLARIGERLERICGGISRVYTATEAGYRRIFFEQVMQGQSQTFRAASMSNGTLRALAILTALEQRAWPSLLCVEEIEDAVHPGALAVLLQAAEEATEPDPEGHRTPFEVLITTHSTEVLSLPQASGERIRVVVSRDGESTVHGLARGVVDLLEPPESVGALLRINALWPDDAPLRIGGDPLVP